MKKKDYRPVVRKESIGSRQPIRNRVSDKKKGLFFPTHNKKKVKKKDQKTKQNQRQALDEQTLEWRHSDGQRDLPLAEPKRRRPIRWRQSSREHTNQRHAG